MIKGYIYILVNPIFPNLIKIGYADDVEKRLETFNHDSGVPENFHVYAMYGTSERLTDIILHNIIDTLNPMLRYNKHREYYKLEAYEAYNLIKGIATINGLLQNLYLNPYNSAFISDMINSRDKKLLDREIKKEQEKTYIVQKEELVNDWYEDFLEEYDSIDGLPTHIVFKDYIAWAKMKHISESNRLSSKEFKEIILEKYNNINGWKLVLESKYYEPIGKVTQTYVYKISKDNVRNTVIEEWCIDYLANNGHSFNGVSRGDAYDDYKKDVIISKNKPMSKLEFTNYIKNNYDMEVLSKYNSNKSRTERMFVSKESIKE